MTDILEQGQKRREKDRLHDQRILQKEQQQFELKNYKKMVVITIISIVIALLSLLFAVFSYYNNASKDITTEAQDIIKDTDTNTVSKK